MKRPKKKKIYKPTDREVGNGAYFDLREIKGYNQAYDDWEKYHKEDIENNYIRKSKLPSKAKIIEIIIDELKKYKEDEKFKFNARMSGKIWTMANWLAKALSKKIRSKK